jgi:hypothetical protein
MNTKSILNLPDKEPWEIVGYRFDWSKYNVISDATDTIASIAFVVYADGDNAESPTALTAMVYATDFSATAFWSQCDVGQTAVNDTEGTYVLRARITCTSGRRYEEQARFRVKETG